MNQYVELLKLVLLDIYLVIRFLFVALLKLQRYRDLVRPRVVLLETLEGYIVRIIEVEVVQTRTQQDTHCT